MQFLAGKQDCQPFPFYVGVVGFSRSKCLTEKTYRFAVLDKNGTKAFQRCIGFNNGCLVGFIVSELNSLAISFLMVSSSFCISLAHKKCTSRFSRLRIRCVFLVRYGINVDMKFTVPRRLCSSSLSLGAASIAMLLTFFGHGSTPYGVKIRPKYSISCFLMQHLFRLNFSSTLHARSTVSNR